jgi:hypothetical protein
LAWKLDISRFPTTYDNPNNSSIQERTIYLKSGLKIYQKYVKIENSGYTKEI